MSAMYSPDTAPAPRGRRYRSGQGGGRSAIRRRIWRASRATVERIRENQWVIPIAAVVLGFGLAWALSAFGQDPDGDGWTVDVDRARDSLMGLLSLVFAGLSIVLAVATVTTQNVVGRFSLRMLRLYQRDLRDKVVIGTFAFTASFIMTEQVRLRGEPPTDLAPIPGVSVALLLIFVSGLTLIWYLSVLSTWFRVDRTARRIAREAVAGARALEERYGDLERVDLVELQPLSGASPILAPRSGYFSGLDVDALYELALAHDVRIVIERLDGAGLVRGESLGWVASIDGSSSSLDPAQLRETIDVTRSLSLEGAVDYRVVVLVDIAIMALSPAVNDPNTAVQIIEELTFLMPQLATFEMGPGAKVDEDGQMRVVVNALGFGDYVDLATEQIVLYGSEDPAVSIALERLHVVLRSLDDLDGPDAAAVERFGALLDPGRDDATASA